MQQAGQLSKYAPGSIREAWSIIYPLILTSASWGVMMFADRFILAQYSTAAMTAAASAGAAVGVFTFGVLGLTMVSEVFVGQRNGAGNFEKVGEPVWQMIWMSLLFSIMFVPLGLYTGDFFTADPYDGMGEPYFRILMIFGSLPAIEAAVSGFFVGIGRPKIVTMIAVISNIINIVFDIILVFGIEGIIEPMGTAGAAIATVISSFVAVSILIWIFLNPANAAKYGTRKLSFSWEVFKKCTIIGAPTSMSHMVEVGAWAVQYHIMAYGGTAYVTITAMAHTTFLLFLFVTDGTSKGITAITSNYLGAGKPEIIKQAVESVKKIMFSMLVISFLFLVIYPDLLLDALIEGKYDQETLTYLMDQGRWTFRWLWMFMLFDALGWIYAGALKGAGDTAYTSTVNGLNAWIVGLVPVTIAIIYFHVSPSTAWLLIGLYGASNMMLMYFRYKAGGWMENKHFKSEDNLY